MCTSRRGGSALRSSSSSGTSDASDSRRLIEATRTTTETGSALRFCWCSRFLSAVMRTSKCSPASRSSSPFSMPLQPTAATVRTSWPASNAARGRGKDSSRRTRTGWQQLLGGELKYGRCLLSPHRWEVVEELVQRISRRKVVDKVLHRDPRPAKDWSASEDVRVAVNHGV